MWPSLIKLLQKVPGFLIIFIFVSLSISLVRCAGGLEHEELTAYDRMIRSRPLEPQDARIVIVGITEKDLQKSRQYPLSDGLLADLIEKIKAQNPRVIGLDIIRDFPQPPGTNKLERVFRETPNLIGAGKISSSDESEELAAIDFPPILKQLHRADDPKIADISIPVDEDYVTRKAFFYPILLKARPDLAEIPSLGAAVARKYLAVEGIGATEAPDRWSMQLGKVTLYRFRKNDGGYVNESDSGYQILINWRGGAGAFKHVSVSDVIEGRISKTLFNERMVLIGAYAPSLNDTLLTPYVKQEGSNNEPPYGVEGHAQLASQIVSAVKDGRPLIKVLPDWAEYVWIVFWIGAATVGIWGFRHRKNPLILLICALAYCGLLTVVILSIATAAFSQACWIPLIPALYGVWGSIILSVTNNLAWQRVREKQDNEQQLKLEIQQYKQELEQKNQQILAQSYQAFLGQNLAGFTHEVTNVFTGFRDIHIAIKNLVSNQNKKLQEQNFSSLYFQEQEFFLELLEENLEEQLTLIERGIILREQYLPIEVDSSNRPAKLTINLHDFLRDCYLFVFKNKQKKYSIESLQFKEEYDALITTIELVPSEINNVLVNLINNAWDALLEKQEQQLENFTPTIKLITKKLLNKIQIIIQDNGIGVAQEIKSKIFQIYFTTKSPGKGTGLGLFQAQSIIVNRYEGDLYHQEIETEQGKETQFVVEIPV
jgi:CHASE2 domain-containing sensor protein/nitrogen-specific signal transduction histidine kinase